MKEGDFHLGLSLNARGRVDGGHAGLLGLAHLGVAALDGRHRGEALAREYAARRFPALADAPLIGARVCQYDLTTDTHFIVAPHPEHAGWWLIGGGSGHGFKHGPALGEYVADCIEGKRDPEAFHALGPRGAHAGLRTADIEV